MRNKNLELKLPRMRAGVSVQAEKLDEGMKMGSTTSRGPVKAKVSLRRSAAFSLIPDEGSREKYAYR